MARRINSLELSGKNLDLKSIKDYHDLVCSALSLKFDSLDKKSDKELILENSFKSITELKQSSIRETDNQASFNILSMIEAQLRIDFVIRIDLKLKDNLSKDFREEKKLHENYKLYKFSLTDVIIKFWIENYPEYKLVLNKLRNAISKFRHWMAHGRYWSPTKWKTDDFSYQELYMFALQFSNSVGKNLYYLKDDKIYQGY